MAGWYLDTTRIFVQSITDDGGQIIPELNPYGSYTVYQVFGKKSATIKVDAIIVGDTDKNTIRDKSRDGNIHTLQTWEGVVYSGYVKHTSFKRTKGICQTIRPDLPSSSPVYGVTITFLREE